MNRFKAVALSALLLAACTPKNEPTPEELAKVMQSKLADAEAMTRNNQLAEAAEIFEWAIDADEQNPAGWAGLGKVRLAEGETEEAIKLLEKAVSLKADDGPANEALGDAYASIDEHAKAAAAYGKVFAADEENAPVGLKYGIALRESGDAAAAEKVFRVVLDIDDNVQFVYTELGDTLRAQKKSEEALKTYMRAQKLYASDKRAHAGAALAYEDMGKMKNAVDEWSMYIRMDCCSAFSKNTAQPKLKALEEAEQESLDQVAEADDVVDEAPEADG